MGRLVVGLVLLGVALSLVAEEMPGVPAGKLAPPFRARDQFAKEQTLSSLMGPNGLVLLFFRSADCDPSASSNWFSCRMQVKSSDMRASG